MSTPLEVVFSRPEGAAKRKGPYARLRFEGELLRERPGGPVIAAHEQHQWQVDGERFLRLDCQCRLQVFFERVDGTRSKLYGPYDHISFVDGVAYANHEVFAFVDRSAVDWYCHDDGHHWPLMIVEAAAQLSR